jgi:hypothetical protein
VDRYTPNQARLFDPKEPIQEWVDLALSIEGDVTLKAGVKHYQYLKRTTDTLSAQIQNLMYQLGTTTTAAQEALHDLQNADAFSRLVEQIDWMDHPSKDDYPSQAHLAYRDILSSDVPHSIDRSPAYRKAYTDNNYPKRDTQARAPRCHRCRQHGHLVRNCPQPRNPRPYARPITAIRQGKKKVVGYKVY